MLENFEGKPRFYFDLFEHRLLTSGAAYEVALESGSHPADLVDLRGLLQQPNYRTLPDVKPKLSTWSPDDIVSLARWLGYEVMDEEIRVVSDHFLGLRRLGLGPQENLIQPMGFTKLYQAAELPNAVRNNLYDDWDIDDFAKYVCKQALSPNKIRGSIHEALKIAARRGEGPSYKTVRERVMGGIPRLLARGGLYSFKSVDDHYIIDWGVDFAKANKGRMPHSGDMSLLSPKSLAPSRATIIIRFTSMERFALEVEDRYLTEQARIEKHNATRFTAIMRDIHAGELPTSIFINCTGPAELRHIAGKYLLLKKLCPEFDEERLASTAQLSVKHIIRTIRRNDPEQAPVSIELKALDIGVFDDVWPAKINNALKVY